MKWRFPTKNLMIFRAYRALGTALTANEPLTEDSSECESHDSLILSKSISPLFQ